MHLGFRIVSLIANGELSQSAINPIHWWWAGYDLGTKLFLVVDNEPASHDVADSPPIASNVPSLSPKL